ncbi:hypothetical protein CC78DRAFT_547431 [Lojkania enalia]|uniref:Protein kinase domain-containing protein n=1 Tax=Lojkania enalia TaxID=147567 RepID=A0A9P4K262_9PLEO|nr:hypothetical protein CC78DRAFT_547431 [Didymosphaeria enalia]
MADGGVVAVAGLVLAAPGVVHLFCNYGQFIKERLETFRTAKDVWVDLGKFGHSLSDGKLKVDIELARAAYTTEGFDPALKQFLEDQVKRLGDEVLIAKSFLGRQNVQSIFGRGMFAIRGERRAKEINKALRKHQQDLSDLLVLVGIAKMQLPDKLLLGPSKFQHNESIGYMAVPFTSDLYVTEGDYKERADTESREISVIIERQTRNEAPSEGNLRDIASYLCYRLADGVPKRGVLRCLGYRMDPAPELVFELPEGMDNPQTLHTLITDDMGKGYAGNHPLDFRFRLARQISEAVLSIHTAKLVHKSIRTAAILILHHKIDARDTAAKIAVGLGEPYLIDWRLVREASGVTSRKRSTSQWTEDIYRHPERQGIQVQQKYNLGHDIYSLGVCLLEVGLWDPLVRTRTADGNPQVSDLFKRVANLDSSEAPETLLEQKLKCTLQVKETLLGLAQRELPPRVGLGYTRLVVACLKCLDTPSGFGAEIDFRKLNTTEAGIAFKELVLVSFPDVLL